MKAKVLLPKEIEITDEELPRLARIVAANRRGAKRRGGHSYSLRELPVQIWEIIDAAATVGLLNLPEGYATQADDERDYYRGKIRSYEERIEHYKQQQRANEQ